MVSNKTVVDIFQIQIDLTSCAVPGNLHICSIHDLNKPYDMLKGFQFSVESILAVWHVNVHIWIIGHVTPSARTPILTAGNVHKKQTATRYSFPALRAGCMLNCACSWQILRVICLQMDTGRLHYNDIPPNKNYNTMTFHQTLPLRYCNLPDPWTGQVATNGSLCRPSHSISWPECRWGKQIAIPSHSPACLNMSQYQPRIPSQVAMLQKVMKQWW